MLNSEVLMGVELAGAISTKVIKRDDKLQLSKILEGKRQINERITEHTLQLSLSAFRHIRSFR